MEVTSWGGSRGWEARVGVASPRSFPGGGDAPFTRISKPCVPIRCRDRPPDCSFASISATPASSCPSELQNTQPPTPLSIQTDLTLPLLQTPPPRSTASEVLGRHPQGGGCQGHLAVNKPACGWGPRTDSAAGAAPMGLGPI